MSRHLTALIPLLLLSAFPGSAAETAPAASREPVAHHDDTPGIDWFGGDVNAAFAESARSRRPVLLYWGAIWCPPCQQLKLTVFSRPDFIAKSRLFVPVYLDGDSEGAQKWGEQFKVTGYPTLVVLDAGRHERMRIAGGMDLNLYADALDLALADLQPADELLATQRALTRDECRRLAYNAWLLADIDQGEAGAVSDRLASAASRCHGDPLSAARLLLNSTYLAAAAGDAGAKARLDARVDAVDALLRTPAAARAAGDALYYLDDKFFAAVKARGATFADAFERRFTSVAAAASQDPHVARADQLDVIATRLQLEIALHGQPQPELVTMAHERIKAELAREPLAYGRSALINGALHIYDALHDDDSAYDLVKTELPRSKNPYYLKADLAAIAESLGHNDEAIALYREAYQESQGIATRFQWGYDYLTALLRLHPDDNVAIAATGDALLGELAGGDRIYSRARVRLERLDAALRRWQAAAPASRSPVIEALRRRMAGICTQIPASETAHLSCEGFLAAGSSATSAG